ncbi:hypothetical protein P886_4299 [Alteromonadaceae bacterium 2753L.S.0a.02]|nr:hypothetical protein P886_4299 [Alteromonadaceae bacterium 2753L.S.0a.02]
MKPKVPQTSSTPLEQLLQRGDVWRGQSQRFLAKAAVDSGHEALNELLLNKGWPVSSLIEICQPAAGHGDWLLLAPAIKHQLQQHPYSHIVLLNPPAMPFAQGLLFAGISLEQLLVVQIANKNDFIASFVELARASSCCLLMAWQPKHTLSYTELRKCQLATADGGGLYVLFRHLQARQQNSPAALRLLLALDSECLKVQIVKQRGQLQPMTSSIQLALPPHLLSQLPHRQLASDAPVHTHAAVNDQVFMRYQPRRNVLALNISHGRPIRVKRGA